MKSSILTAAAAAATLLGASLAIAEGIPDTVRLGTEGAYPPYNFINDSGDVDGFERELGDELCKRANLTCTWVTNDWDSIIPNLVSGNYDAIIAGMSITDERREKIDFTSNYTRPDPSSYLAMSEDVDLQNGIIAAQAGTIQAAYVSETGATMLEFATPEEAVAAVRNGEADAMFLDKSFVLPIAEEDPSLMLVGEDILLGDGMALGIRKSDSDLRDAFSTAIDEMKADGSLNALIEKWLPGAAVF